VTGAAGTLGGQVVGLLAAHGGHEVVAVSRRPVPDLPPRTVPARADYADPRALRTAFDGVGTLVFVSSDGEAVNVLCHHQNVVRAAAEAGVGHIVALSGLDADITSPFCYAVTYGHTERLLRASGCAVSIARASIFTEFFLSFLRTARRGGQLRLPAGDGRISLVSMTDVGRGLAALALAPPAGRVHELTGPAALDLDQVAAAASRGGDPPIAYADVSPAAFQRDLAAGDLDPWWCYAFSSMFASIRQHRWEQVTDEVLRLTGRQPIPVSDLLPAR
jgi:NAD(P)H dehydrogenase (quinone)